MSERNDIVLRPEGAPRPTGFFDNLKSSLEEMISPALDAAAKFAQGKGEAEIAKAAEIKAKVLSAFAQIEHEREKLIMDRDAAIRASVNEQERDRMAHAEKMYELKTERLLKIVESLKNLRELGVEVEIRVLKQFAAKLIKAAEE